MLGYGSTTVMATEMNSRVAPHRERIEALGGYL
jgi:hypothetical protein